MKIEVGQVWETKTPGALARIVCTSAVNEHGHRVLAVVSNPGHNYHFPVWYSNAGHASLRHDTAIDLVKLHLPLVEAWTLVARGDSQDEPTLGRLNFASAALAEEARATLREPDLYEVVHMREVR